MGEELLVNTDFLLLSLSLNSWEPKEVGRIWFLSIPSLANHTCSPGKLSEDQVIWKEAALLKVWMLGDFRDQPG